MIQLLILALLCCVVCATGAVARPTWQVFLDGADVTASAVASERNGIVSVNVVTLSTALGIGVNISKNQLLLIDYTGVQWQVQSGSMAVESSGKVIRLKRPAFVQGAFAYLAVDAVGELAGLHVNIDTTSKRVDFSSNIAAVAPGKPEAVLNTPMKESGWQMFLDGADVTASAVASERDGIVSVNVVTLSRALKMGVKVTQNQLLLTDSNGNQWQVENGSMTVESSGKVIRLKRPAFVQGAFAYLAVDAVGELAGLQVKTDTASRRINCNSQAVAVAVVAAPAPAPAVTEAVRDAAVLDVPVEDSGWQAFSLDKSSGPINPEEVKTSLGDGSKASKIICILPPEHNSLRMGIGLGYVQGADFGTELSASGRIKGVYMNFGSMLTSGDRGVKMKGGRLALLDRDRGWGAEAGDLFSELNGVAHGVRYSWRSTQNRWPSIAIYSTANSASKRGTVLAYSDGAVLNQYVSIGGELASDGSSFVKGHYEKGRFSTSFFSRSVSDHAEDGSGFFASYYLKNGISIYGGISRSGTGSDAIGMQALSLRFPLRRGLDLFLENTHSSTDSVSNSVNSAAISLPLGDFRFMTRYELRDNSALKGGLVPARYDNSSRAMITSAFYFPNPKLSFDYSIATRWTDGGQSDSWEQLTGTYRLSSRTQLQTITSFPGVFDPDSLRVRLNHDLGSDFALALDYGRLNPYQGIGITPGERGFTAMLRYRWDISTPSSGGIVRGRVIDQLGKPMAEVAVRLGMYRTKTDESGYYIFQNVPAGSYEVALDESSLPANYKNISRKQQIAVNVKTRKMMDFSLMPLNSIAGQVFWDRNGSGDCDANEGLPCVVLMLNGFPTITDEHGWFRFYNVEPGKHVITLDRNRLPAGYALISQDQIAVNLTPEQPVTDANFVVTKQEKEIIFQAIM